MKLLMVVSLLMSLCCGVNAQIKFVDNGQILGNANATGVDIGDIDNDGDLDAFAINGQWNVEEPNKIWFNDGNGKFTVSDQVFGNSKCGEVGLADLDGDGDLDAFIAYYNYMGGEPNQVWFNDGTGHFTDSGQRMGHRNGGVALADLDGDGDMDAFICNHVFDDGTNGCLEIWLNNGTGYFTNSGQNLGNGNHTGVCLGDVDNDGDIDAFVTFNYGDAGNRIWLNDGHGNFSQGQQVSMTFSADAKFGDLDNDGDLDIFLTHTGGNKVWLNDGTGHFTDSGQALGSSETSAVGLGDLDGDDDLDAFIINSIYQGARPNEVWINNGHGVFINSGLRLGNDEGQDVKLGDLDGDDDLDAFVANSGGNKIYFNVTGDDSTTGIGQNQDIPQEFKLMQNYPNPFNPSTTIRYSFNRSSQVRLAIFNILGQRIRTLIDAFQSAGEYSITWDARNENYQTASSGIYFYRLEAGNLTFKKKMFLIR